MGRTSNLSLGDLLLAAGKLEADEETILSIARLLKLAPTPVLKTPEGRDDAPRAEPGPAVAPGAGRVGGSDMAEDVREVLSRIAAKRREARLAKKEQAQAQALQTTEALTGVVVSREPEEDRRALPSALAKVAGGAAEVPQWAAEVAMLPKANERPAAQPPDFEPLLLPLWTRALLSGALARRAEDGPIDLERVVEMVARGEVTTRLPQLPRPTLARGVLLLIDRGETMLPFREDQEWLEEQVRRVAGLSFDRTLYFEGCPTRRAGPGGRSGWKQYPTPRTPKSGAVLLVLTDLGIGRPLWPGASAGEGEWGAFARAMRKRGCAVVAFVPYAPERWPAGLLKLMTIIQWDRPTSASLVHARVGKGHGT